MMEMLQGDELVAIEGEVRDADAPLLPDELGHSLELLLADVDKLASVIYHACQQPVLLQLCDPVYGLLCLEMELRGKVLQQHNLGLLDVVDELEQLVLFIPLLPSVATLVLHGEGSLQFLVLLLLFALLLF